MTLARLASLRKVADQSLLWRLLAEFLEEYRREPVESRHRSLAGEPPSIELHQVDRASALPRAKVTFQSRIPGPPDGSVNTSGRSTRVNPGGR